MYNGKISCSCGTYKLYNISSNVMGDKITNGSVTFVIHSTDCPQNAFHALYLNFRFILRDCMCTFQANYKSFHKCPVVDDIDVLLLTSLDGMYHRVGFQKYKLYLQHGLYPTIMFYYHFPLPCTSAVLIHLPWRSTYIYSQQGKNTCDWIQTFFEILENKLVIYK